MSLRQTVAILSLILMPGWASAHGTFSHGSSRLTAESFDAAGLDTDQLQQCAIDVCGGTPDKIETMQGLLDKHNTVTDKATQYYNDKIRPVLEPRLRSSILKKISQIKAVSEAPISDLTKVSENWELMISLANIFSIRAQEVYNYAEKGEAPPSLSHLETRANVLRLIVDGDIGTDRNTIEKTLGYYLGVTYPDLDRKHALETLFEDILRKGREVADALDLKLSNQLDTYFTYLKALPTVDQTNRRTLAMIYRTVELMHGTLFGEIGKLIKLNNFHKDASKRFFSYIKNHENFVGTQKLIIKKDYVDSLVSDLALECQMRINQALELLPTKESIEKFQPVLGAVKYGAHKFMEKMVSPKVLAKMLPAIYNPKIRYANTIGETTSSFLYQLETIGIDGSIFIPTDKTPLLHLAVLLDSPFNTEAEIDLIKYDYEVSFCDDFSPRNHDDNHTVKLEWTLAIGWSPLYLSQRDIFITAHEMAHVLYYQIQYTSNRMIFDNLLKSAKDTVKFKNHNYGRNGFANTRQCTNKHHGQFNNYYSEEDYDDQGLEDWADFAGTWITLYARQQLGLDRSSLNNRLCYLHNSNDNNQFTISTYRKKPTSPHSPTFIRALTFHKMVHGNLPASCGPELNSSLDPIARACEFYKEPEE